MAPKKASKVSCIDAMKEIFHKINPIQVFAYDFAAVDFEACRSSTQELNAWHKEAFVVTESDWLKPEFVHVYNHASVDGRADRQLIQSMFVQAPRSYPTEPGTTPAPVEKLWTDVDLEVALPELSEHMLKNFFACRSGPPYQAR